MSKSNCRQQTKEELYCVAASKRTNMKATITTTAIFIVVCAAAAEANYHHPYPHHHHKQHQDNQAERNSITACPGQHQCVQGCNYDHHGNPFASYYCSSDPCPPKVCCSHNEETCYNENNIATSCARMGECPCPENKIRCGNSTNSAGWCDVICCDPNEETCTDDEGPFCSKHGNNCSRAGHSNLRAQR